MKITAIKQQVKRADRYSIYVDGKYAFSLSDTELIKLTLKVGQELGESEFRTLQNTAKLDKAYMRSLDLISRRARSEWEIRDYLKRKEYGVETQNTIVYKLKQVGLLDDLSFARQWASSRRALKLRSRRKLTSELRQKRVSDDVIAEVLADEENDDQKVLRELVERKRRQTKYQDKLKLMQYLSRQGFNYDDIKKVVEEE
jgi:regulatory protein